MELFEELTRAIDCLDCIEEKDWYRAKTVDWSRVNAMLSAITNPKKMVGRVLAIYYYNKFALNRDYIHTKTKFFDIDNFLIEYLTDYVRSDVISKLLHLNRERIYPWVSDKEVLTKMQENDEYEEEDTLGFFNEDYDEDDDIEIDDTFVITLKETEDEIDEALSYDLLNKYEKSLYEYLKKEELYPEDLWLEDENNQLIINISIDGDWKHDHLRCDYLINRWANENGFLVVEHSSEVTRASDSDDYGALRTYILKYENEKVLSENMLEETYSDEELDKLIGKTYNQQKILNIYRRQKYGDSRLFANTTCIKCGRNKKVFLSNLLNDPEKYGSCVCSDTNVESRLDNIEDLFRGGKKLSNNTSGYTGVTYVKNYKGKLYDKWRAYIEIDGKRTYLGDFDSKSGAVKARKKAAEKGLKWYKQHKDEFMKNYRRKSKRHRGLRSYKKK